MKALIQRVTSASVKTGDAVIAEISQGILALIGIEKSDNETQADKLLDKILHYRIFADVNDKMNLSVVDVQGGLLLVSQFTLVADTKSGTRPGFSIAMPPEPSKILFEYFCKQALNQHPYTATGLFGANMQVSLCNDGPVTFLLST
jgi:D-tyrosyl-tRNA(Tyr) deacylase